MNLWNNKSYHWHAIAGAAVSTVADFGHVVPWFTLLIVGAIGFAHELGDGCYTMKPDAPWSGVLDTLSFIPVPLVIWAKAVL